MSTETFEIGDVVDLRSGGPSMTVYAVDDNGIHCMYWNGTNGKFEYQSFDPILLKEV